MTTAEWLDAITWTGIGLSYLIGLINIVFLWIGRRRPSTKIEHDSAIGDCSEGSRTNTAHETSELGGGA